MKRMTFFSWCWLALLLLALVGGVIIGKNTGHLISALVCWIGLDLTLTDKEADRS